MTQSLSTHPYFVTDAFARVVQTQYEPEDIRLGVYSFLPWVRTGLSSIVSEPSEGNRASVKVTMDVEDNKGGKTPVEKTLTLRGPGDVLGLQPSQIVRRFPAPNTPDAQETFLAYVEFDRPELPWLFTPKSPSGTNQERLSPWLALIVLEEKHATFLPPTPGVPQRPIKVLTKKGQLQPLSNSWAFAHAQVSGDTGGVSSVSVRADGKSGVGPDSATPSLRDRLSDQYGPVNLSRLLCPRRLDDGINYVACIVPAFDCGVKTGLGLPGGTLDAAWVRSSGDEEQDITLPVYDHWRFSTAKGGDFEELARRLVPIKAPWKVGRRFIDTHLPRGGVTELATEDPGRVQVLKCALFSLSNPPAGSPPEEEGWTQQKREELRDELDRGDATALSSTFENVDLPKVGTRIYARFQRGESRIGSINQSDWFDQLNTTPAHRIIAGLGTRVVQKDQEVLMQSAWAQVGAIDKANKAMARMQFARFLGESLHQRYLKPLGFSSLIQLTRAIHGKVKLQGSSLTIRGDLERSYVAPSVAGLPFRRAARPRGAIARFANPAARVVLDQLLTVGDKLRDFRRPYENPDGIDGLNEDTLRAIPVDVVAKALGVRRDVAINTLRARLDVLNNHITFADQIEQPLDTGPTRRRTIDPSVIGKRMFETLKAVARAEGDVEKHPAQFEAIGTLLNGLAKSGVREIERNAEAEVNRILPKLKTLVRQEPSPNHRRAPTPRRPTPSRPTPGRIAERRIPGRTVRGPTVMTPTSRRLSRTRSVRRASVTTAVLRPPLASRVELLKSAKAEVVGMNIKAVSRTRMDHFATMMSKVASDIGLRDLRQPNERRAPKLSQVTLMAELNPARTMTKYVHGRLKKFPSWLSPDWFSDGRVQPIMAAPEFKRPMFEALEAYDRDWLVPGLGLIKQTDFVTLLETNAAFTEAFLVGLSDEMGRELLWREYPTDQRGTYFKYFWDDDEEELTTPIHRFSRQPLGEHIAGGSEGRVVFVVRGELIKRFPDAIMMALREIPSPPAGSDSPVFMDPEVASARVIFQAKLQPDILLVGFDLTAEQVKSQKWWFFIAEHPTAPRFGLDAENNAPALANSIIERNNLDWDDIVKTHNGRFISTTNKPMTIRERSGDPPPQQVQWPPSSSAVLARVFLQNPIRAAYDGSQLVDDIDKGPNNA